MRIEEILQFLGLQCFLLAAAQGQISQMTNQLNELQAAAAKRARRARKG